MSLHSNIVVRKTGFHVSAEQPFLGASPDGLIDCAAVCGEGVLEVKCPFSCTAESKVTMEQRAADSSSFCLQTEEDGAMFLIMGIHITINANCNYTLRR